MQFSGLRSWERAPAWIPFSDSLQWLFSVAFYLKDYPFCCNWWNFILFNGWVIILLKIYKHAFLQIKYPCFTWDLGPLCSSYWLQSWSMKTVTVTGFEPWPPWAYKGHSSDRRQEYPACGHSHAPRAEWKLDHSCTPLQEAPWHRKNLHNHSWGSCHEPCLSQSFPLLLFL